MKWVWALIIIAAAILFCWYIKNKKKAKPGSKISNPKRLEYFNMLESKFGAVAAAEYKSLTMDNMDMSQLYSILWVTYGKYSKAVVP